MPTYKQLAYALLRIALGVNFLGHGLFRILAGVPAFAAATADHMAKSPFPHGFNYAFACAIPFLELLLGLGLIAVTSNQQWDVAGQQLLYSLIFFVLLFLLEYNSLALDARLRPAGSVQ